MAAQVYSGTGNFSYTNNTGQNVRIIINFCRATGTGNITMSWASGVSLSISAGGSNMAFGRNLAFYGGFAGTGGALIGNNMTAENFNSSEGFGAPTEIMLSNLQTFSITSGFNGVVDVYNIVVIPEGG